MNVLRKDIETKDKALEDLKSSVKQVCSLINQSVNAASDHLINLSTINCHNWFRLLLIMAGVPIFA